ncbi:MAG: S-methyl-5'-thioadenosine phosphorylase [Caldisericaceae bacterium]|nr:S-methyl-5'-thioadenosine phosphorylase [Caldisericaceae bacterium]
MKSIGIIGGTGVYTPDFLQNAEPIAVKTEFGTVNLIQGELEGRNVFFETRHGTGHTVPPHKINYRANIFSLYKLGVERIIATAAVGSINREILPGTFVIVDQFLDFTKKREDTFFSQDKVVHTDCTDPYCPELAMAIQKAMEKFDYPYSKKGTYVSVEGPRFETRAEIQAYSILGGDVVGMTGVPEVVLARELGMCYATIAAVANYAAGISDHMISHKEVVEKMGEMNKMFRNVLSEVVINIPGERHCSCSKAPTSGD